MRKYIGLFFWLSLHICYAQNSISGDSFAGLSAFENFQARKYENVIGNLQSKQVRTQDEDILLYLSELKTGKEGEKRIEAWLNANPKHPIGPLVKYHLGEYYYYTGDTLRCKKNLSNISANELSKRDRSSYGYVYGLLMLDESKYENAKNLFQFSRKNEFHDLDKLSYYEGYAEYHLGNNEEAFEKLEKVKDSDEFESSAKFFLAKMRLENGESDQVIALAQNELSDEKSITNSGFYQLVGEAYALNNQVEKADAFFGRAIELHPSRPSAALYYQAGVSKFKIGNEDLAIQFLMEAGIQGGEYAQLSAFQLGRLYLNKKDYENALSAYIEASASDQESIKEESYFQVASINAQLSQFTQAITYAIDYLNLYKNTQRRETMQNLIAQSYLRTSNYDLAIQHLNTVGIANETQKSVYQKVTYQKAVLSFNDGNFSEADNWFRESLRFPQDRSLKDDAHYHLAEIAMRANDFDNAIIQYKNQSSLNSISNYGIGYAYFNKKQYQKAIPYFRKAETSESNVRNDAKVRLADCLYATKSYKEAFTTYNQLSQTVESSYVTFQKGMTLRNMDRKSEAIELFKNLFNEPRYASQAKFQAGMIQFEAANFPSAEGYFSQVIKDHPNSTFNVESLLNRGVARKNLGKLDEAKNDYEAILENHIDSEIAINAILGLQELQQAGLKITNLDNYIEQYKTANPESGSLELIEFEAAKRLYFDFTYEKAAESFNKYLNDYPSTGNKYEAMYYQADSYYRIEEFESAKPIFDELKFVRNPFTGRILNRLGEINKRLEYFTESEEAYKLLIDLDLTPKDTYNANQGLMHLYFGIEDYRKAILAADEIIKAEWKPLNASQEATMVKAKSWMQLNDVEKAKSNFESLSGEKNQFGAEANYHLGFIAYQSADYDQSLDLLFELNTNYGSYTQWVDRSYLLIATNYIAKEDLFQAKATLRSIIQHSKNEEVKKESQLILIQIEQDFIQSDSTQTKD
ncbi:tetratricopeptide repeat protein [Ekhidna sp. To15]|uniref:tetratricopeptide repeat protein n=1 Tax=Ekhidna sp. To15 TaxID=3395267 RepID=UPI003F524246